MGYDSERGKRALRRLNHLHGRFAIANEDFLNVLSTFIFEPIRRKSKIRLAFAVRAGAARLFLLLARGRPADEHPRHSRGLFGFRMLQ